MGLVRWTRGADTRPYRYIRLVDRVRLLVYTYLPEDTSAPPLSLPLRPSQGTLMPSPRPPALKLLHRLDRSSPGFQDQLCDVFYGEEYQRLVPNLQDDDSVWLVEYLNEVRLQIVLPYSPFKPF